MGNNNSAPPPPPPPPPPPQAPIIPTYSQGVNVFKVPNNSGSIDIDVPNLQRCIIQGGGQTCISNYVQGYDTSDNMFVPTQLTSQGFELVDGQNNNDNNNSSHIVLIIFIILVLLVVFVK